MSTASIIKPFQSRRYGPLCAGRVLGVMAFLFLPLALFAPKALALLFVIAAVLVFVLTFDICLIRSIIRRPITLIFAVFLAFGALSTVWSIEPTASIVAALRLSMTFFSGLYLAHVLPRLEISERETFNRGIFFGGVLGLSLILFEFATDALLAREIWKAKGMVINLNVDPMRALNAGMAVVPLYIWPWAVAVKKRYGSLAMVGALLIGLVMIYFSSAETPIFAYVVGIVVAALTLLSRKIMLATMATVSVIGIALAPLVPSVLPDPYTEAHTYPMLSRSAVHRLAIWRTAVEHISKDPLFGIGLDGTRYLYNNSDKITRYYSADGAGMKWENKAEPIPLHAHNGILQIWLELGGIGAMIFTGIMLTVMWHIRQVLENGVVTAAYLAMLASGTIIFSISFGPWQSWWQATIWLTVVAMSGADTFSRKKMAKR